MVTAMTDDLARYFDDEAGAAGRARARRSAASCYEDAAVRKVLALLRQEGLAGMLARAEEEHSGQYTCTFARLHDALPDLPVRFGAGRLRYLKRIAVPDLFDRFTKTPIFLALEDLACELDPALGALAFVFRWASDARVSSRAGRVERKGIRGGKFMVIHTAPTAPQPGATRIVRACMLGGHACEVTIETLEALLAPYVAAE
jgi:hypothetical protein